VPAGAARCALSGGDGSGPLLPPSADASGGLGGAMRDLRGLWGQLAGPSADDRAGELQRDLEPRNTEDLEFVPLVLVVGATGRTGRIIVRKLVLQGFRVAVLVRSLSTDTLNLLGSGVSYSYGDMTDYRSLLDAMEDVDRVIFAADAADDEELQGLSQVLRSFQDTRTFMYGDAEATKLSLLKMRRDRDFNRWRVETSSADVTDRLSSAGIGPKPSIAYWKRSPTGAHRNGVFVGKVFDTYLGSAAVSCSLSGLLLGSTPVSLSAANDTSVAAAASAVASGVRATALHAEGNAQQHDQETDDQLFAAAEVDRAVAAAVAAEVPLNLGEYSGLVVRAIGDGKKYTVVLRTAESFRSGLEYHADFESSTKNFDTVRLPFSTFVPVRDGRRAAGAPELDRRQLVSLALAFYPQRNNPTQTTGEFYLSVSNVKAYRKRDEPEIVYISDAAAAADEVEAPETVPARVQTKLRGEHMLRSSGLTYFIVRPTQLTDAPSSRRLSFTQGGVVSGSVSRADVAEVAVRSLLDPRACNVACTVTESEAMASSSLSAPGKSTALDVSLSISKALEVLEPNR